MKALKFTILFRIFIRPLAQEAFGGGPFSEASLSRFRPSGCERGGVQDENLVWVQGFEDLETASEPPLSERC